MLNARHDSAARERVILASRAIISALYSKYYRALEWEEAVQVGFVAIIVALDKFVPSEHDVRGEWCRFAWTKVNSALNHALKLERKYWDVQEINELLNLSKVSRLNDYYCYVCNKPYAEETDRNICKTCWQRLGRFEALTGEKLVCEDCAGIKVSRSGVAQCLNCAPSTCHRCQNRPRKHLVHGLCESCDRHRWRMVAKFGVAVCPDCTTMLVSFEKLPHCPNCNKNTLAGSCG